MHLSRCIRTCFCFAMTLGAVATASAGTIYVDAAATTGADDGTSWSNAFRGAGGVERALAVAVAGDEVWVTAGTYLPTSTGDRTRSFVLIDEIALYGGFAGGETNREDRNPAARVSTLCGDLAGDDASGQKGDNSLCVLKIGSAVLDGFTITGGNGDGSGAAGSGAGIQAVYSLAEPVVRACVIRDNRCIGSGGGLQFGGFRGTFQDCRFERNTAMVGGAASIRQANHAIFSDCVFEENEAGDAGGAAYVEHVTDAEFLGCRFEGNVAGNSGGAARVAAAYDGIFLRCILSGNSAHTGGALDVSMGSSELTTIRGCLFTANTATFGTINVNGGLANETLIDDTTIAANTGGGILLGPGNEARVRNSILYSTGGSTSSNMTVRYSCTEFPMSGPGNIAVDPQFVDAAGGNFRLKPTSPCIDAGESLYSVVGYDLDRTARREDVPAVSDTGTGLRPYIDMGAYETPGGLFTLACAGDSRLTRDCPCGNASIDGSGCLNSGSYVAGAMLVAYGTAHPDTVVLKASDLRPSAACVLLQGDAINGTGFVLGDGLRCVAGTLKRMSSQTTTTGGLATFPSASDPSISARSAALGDPIQPGQRRHYQVWYRDPDPSFCPPPAGSTSNLSSAITVYW